MDRNAPPATPVVRLTLLRWGTIVNMRGPLGRRMLRVYIAQSLRLRTATTPRTVWDR